MIKTDKESIQQDKRSISLGELEQSHKEFASLLSQLRDGGIDATGFWQGVDQINEKIDFESLSCCRSRTSEEYLVNLNIEFPGPEYDRISAVMDRKAQAMRLESFCKQHRLVGQVEFLAYRLSDNGGGYIPILRLANDHQILNTAELILAYYDYMAGQRPDASRQEQIMVGKI